MAYPIDEAHDAGDIDSAYRLARDSRIPVGLIYKKEDSIPAHERLNLARERIGAKQKSVEELFQSMVI